MSRHLRILDHAVSTLLQSPFKTFVITSIYSLLVATVVSLVLYVDAHHREAEALLRSSPDVVVQRLRGGRHELSPSDRAGVIREIRGVSDVTPRVWGYSFDPPTGATLTLWGAKSIPEEALEFHEGSMPDGRSGGACVIGRGIADARFLGLGDRMPFRCADGELVAPVVRGIFTADSAMLTNDLVVLPTETVRRILGIETGFSTDLAVDVANPNEVDVVARKILERWPDARAVTRRQILQTYDAVFDWRGGVWMVVISGAIAAFSILVWDRASGLSIDEYRSIGVLKAVGWKTSEVMELKAAEGLVISAFSSVTGLIAAEIHLNVFNGVGFAPVIKGWSVLYPSFDVTPELGAYGLLVCIPLAVLPYVAASLVPAWRAAVTDPDTVMRA
jgi:ABC-type lipoprotein release transport system permease subunit